MSYSFVNKPAVRFDIIEAVTYYKNINPKLALQFLFRVREAKVYIERSPVGFQIKYNVVRTLLLKQFPYHIHYIINDSEKQILFLLLFMLTEIQRIILADKRTIADTLRWWQLVFEAY